jgi:hypothetical protein
VTGELLFNVTDMKSKGCFICLLLMCSCGTPEYLSSFIIDTSCDFSVVEGELNGKKTYFLLDTGAGITTFDLNQCKQYGFTSVATDLEIGGFTNDKTNIRRAVGITSIKINGIELTGETTYANNMTNLVRFVENCSCKTISGIIGAPIIKRHGLVIDLTNGRLFRVN